MNNNIDRYILQVAINQLEKDLVKQNKKVSIVSEEVKNNDPFGNKSQRKRALARVKLISECEQRDRMELYIARAKEMCEGTY